MSNKQTQTSLREPELAKRWGISRRTLEKWRALGYPPAHHKIGRSIVYMLSDIEAYERRNRVVPHG